ncbi:hypothetical protein ASE74_04315 [Pedobacter sp. Leaf216]|uniref:hypothetical protein n=1 Tax=Pedobacter sp. Leaf216 TaxID=1735684 RepID=UPI0006F3A2E5|nr:hypothetical protein [Pedobacter sp. Leaf216]KQM69243.1 hypothetical protein ASE74_04315 [Pedobacter sp. Leaf216]
MKRLLPILLVLFTLVACKKEKQGNYSESITKGEKWGIRIGSSHSEVFAQLQKAGPTLDFQYVSIFGHKPFTSPEALNPLLPYYYALTIYNNTGTLDRAVLLFSGNKIEQIAVGGGLTTGVTRWPANAADDTAIKVDDPVSALAAKLIKIHQLPVYSSYGFVLSDKPLNKPYDPDMDNQDEWQFGFSDFVNASVTGASTVTLHFKAGKLERIDHDYREGQIFN